MSTLSTHVLDTARGAPIPSMAVTLDRQEGGDWIDIVDVRTDTDGRAGELVPDGVAPGVYRLRFATGEFFSGRGATAFYPEVSIVFTIVEADGHYHVPLLLSPFGYTTYRGS